MTKTIDELKTVTCPVAFPNLNAAERDYVAIPKSFLGSDGNSKKAFKALIEDYLKNMHFKGWRTAEVEEFVKWVQLICQKTSISEYDKITEILEFCNETLKTAPKPECWLCKGTGIFMGGVDGHIEFKCDRCKE